MPPRTIDDRPFVRFQFRRIWTPVERSLALKLQKSFVESEIFRSRSSLDGSTHFSVLTALPPLIPLWKIRRPAACQKPIPAMATLTTSAIMAVPHDPLDVRPVGNSQTEQCAVIELCQGGNGPFDLLLAFAAARLRRAFAWSPRIVAWNAVPPRGSVRLSE